MDSWKKRMDDACSPTEDLAPFPSVSLVSSFLVRFLLPSFSFLRTMLATSIKTVLVRAPVRAQQTNSPIVGRASSGGAQTYQVDVRASIRGYILFGLV
jgi:hypothetical protein|mmetsp:Transcript_896/g.2601  ORF Transcript_896/g.2601 Transcript_896/m.2601 type:complete len:98 (-) Transcript_896:185-478(-)